MRKKQFPVLRLTRRASPSPVCRLSRAPGSEWDSFREVLPMSL
jgi:hypothetical protein